MARVSAPDEVIGIDFLQLPLQVFKSKVYVETILYVALYLDIIPLLASNGEILTKTYILLLNPDPKGID